MPIRLGIWILLSGWPDDTVSVIWLPTGTEPPTGICWMTWSFGLVGLLVHPLRR